MKTMCMAMCVAGAVLYAETAAAAPKKPPVKPPAKPAPYRPGPMLRKFLDGPMRGAEAIVFAVRVPGRDHWYVNFGYYCNKTSIPKKRAFREDGVLWGYAEGGRLCKMNLRTGKVTVLLDDPRGGVRDPQVHYDGKKILFSYRKGGTHTYHLYEIGTDPDAPGGIKQLTDGPDDDIEPTYLPGGQIMFGSSRCRRVVNCWHSRVAILYRCDADGRNVRMLSSNLDHDNTPWTLPDGRVLYMRWEYVDRSQVHYHHLWTANPDGTNQTVYYGNLHPGVAMLDAKPIPGTDKVVVSFSPGHGRTEHTGAVTIVDPNAGPDERSTARRISRNTSFRDPYAFSEKCFLVANRAGIYVMDHSGKTELVYALPAKQAKSRKGHRLECHEPRPIRPRKREPVIPSRIDTSLPTGQLFLTDIYAGRNMKGVRRGEIKKLLVLEQLPKPVNFSGGMEPLTIGGSFTLARIVGTVPVEPNGSAYMEVPALRSLFFVALDKNDLSIKRMHSFLTVQPGETLGCVGCHEHRTRAPHFKADMLTAGRKARPVEPIKDVPDVIDYPRDVQPILDQHCVKCHNPDRRDGKIDLCGDHTPYYSVSYWTMNRHRLFTDNRNRPVSNLPPRSTGSSASKLMKYLDPSHYKAKPTARQRKVIRLWIDTSATYPGTYAALGCGMYYVTVPRLLERCGSCHAKGGKDNRGRRRCRFGLTHDLRSLYNLDRPAKSIVLQAPLAKKAGGLELCGKPIFTGKNDPDYVRFLAAIQDGARRLKQGKRFDMKGFRPNPDYIREMQSFGILPKDLPPNAPIDPYKTDQAYWRSFWWTGRPPKPAG